MNGNLADFTARILQATTWEAFASLLGEASVQISGNRLLLYTAIPPDALLAFAKAMDCSLIS